MSGIKVDIVWSPSHLDRFITIGTDLRLYQVEDTRNGSQRSEAIALSDFTSAYLLSINSDNHYMKCVSWYPQSNPENLLAVGQASGKVVLTSFEEFDQNSDIIGREFVPKHARQCNAVAWNPVENSLLAAGLEKYRADSGLLVWDVFRSQQTPVTAEIAFPERRQVTMVPLSENSGSYSRPVAELGLSETVHSLSWFNMQPKTLACGMNNKHIKIFDLRDSTKHHNATPTKAVFGICVDPDFEHCLASFVENQVVLWDVRNFEKPVATVHEARTVLKVAWCPTRYSLLASVTKDSSVVKLYDIQHSPMGSDDLEPMIVERFVQPYDQHAIASFAWHWKHENRMLIITPSGTIKDYIVFDWITLNWSPTSELVWTQGKEFLQCVDHRDKIFDFVGDITAKMAKRALAGYGMKFEQLWQNAEITAEDAKLHGLWTWFDLVKSLQEEGRLVFKRGEVKFEGVRSIVCGEGHLSGIASRSEPYLKPWVGVDAAKTLPKIAIYISPERDKALQLCGWGADVDGATLSMLLDKLEGDGQHARAAAIAIFNLMIRRAINILNRGAGFVSSEAAMPDVTLNVVAMALSGYSEHQSLWREMCSKLRHKLQNPYLRATFAFLTSENDSYEEVLNETAMTIPDRVAFACIFLPDSKLADFLVRLTSKMVETGDMDGILLTGIGQEGLSLLQCYVDVTADVQTASLIVAQAMPPSLTQDQRAKQWVESYRELLNRWRLWHQRAMFDVQWNKVNASGGPPEQVFVSCNFCGKSITSYLQMMNQGSAAGARGFSRVNLASANRLKITACMGCRKPLPRCALCLTHMGTPSGSNWKTSKEEKPEGKLTKFSTWFTWCQTCRHGGHSIHITDWFKEHMECPVTGCNCKCASLDSVSKVNTFTNSFVSRGQRDT